MNWSLYWLRLTLTRTHSCWTASSNVWQNILWLLNINKCFNVLLLWDDSNEALDILFYLFYLICNKILNGSLVFIILMLFSFYIVKFIIAFATTCDIVETIRARISSTCYFMGVQFRFVCPHQIRRNTHLDCAGASLPLWKFMQGLLDRSAKIFHSWTFHEKYSEIKFDVA